MQIGSIAAIGPKNQSALKLITDIVETSRSDQTRPSSERKPWSAATAASALSTRSASAIQDLVQGKAAGTTTFKILGGRERTVPTDEYEFAARTEFKTADELADYYRRTQAGIYEGLLDYARSVGNTEQAEYMSGLLDSFKRAIATGTLTVELLDERVSGNDYDYTGVRDSKGNVGGMRGVNVTPLDWNAFNNVYGDGQGGYDRHYEVGGNYFMRGYVISWPK